MPDQAITTQRPASTVTTTRVGRRTYIEGNTFAHRDTLRDAGAHWDSTRRAWWIGDDTVAKALAAKIAEAGATNSSDGDRLEYDRNHILGRATYGGRSYYLVGRGTNAKGDWVRLLFRDGSQTLFKAAREVQIEKLYQEPKTLRSLQEFSRAAKSGSRGAECGDRPGTIECSDSSGLTGLCCRRCAQGPSYQRSFM